MSNTAAAEAGVHASSQGKVTVAGATKSKSNGFGYTVTVEFSIKASGQ